MLSIKEKMQAMEEKLATGEQELVALRAACDDYKVQNEAVKADLEAAKTAIDAATNEKKEADELFKSELQARDEAIAIAEKSIEDMKAKMALAPFADADAKGIDPVADGSIGGNDVDYEAEMNKLEGSAARIAYYRAHKEEIDKG